MKSVRTLIVSVLFMAIAVGTTVWLYPRLPAQVPIHWDMNGLANGYAPRFWGAAMWPLLISGLAVLTVVLPAISPRRFEIEPFAGIYGALMLVIQGVMLVIGMTALLVGAGFALPLSTIVPLAVGVLLMVLGNYMGKLRKNFFIGIRTPWTLASDAVWERTHRLAGWVFVLAGMAMVIATLAHAMPGWGLVAIVAMLLIPYVYSFFAYRAIEGRH
ncbi:SdpI family protein [Rhodanobacter umsongensis]|uniref:SdpI family protein n=1 Tax=Rhodanobacter umsongensis TaxID=633153 RepID=A0ABW0JPW0_9GAMM